MDSGGNSGYHMSPNPSVLPKLGETSKPSSKSGDSLHMDGDVKAVKALEFGADIKGSWSSRSWGDTVPRLETELDMLPPKSKAEEMAGDDNVDTTPSKAGKSPKSTSAG